MDISLLLEPQAKHQRMHRGDSMYSEQSLVELNAIPCTDCDRSFVPMAYVRHFDGDGRPKCKSVFNKKRPVFDSSKVIGGMWVSFAVIQPCITDASFLANTRLVSETTYF